MKKYLSLFTLIICVIMSTNFCFAGPTPTPIPTPIVLPPLLPPLPPITRPRTNQIEMENIMSSTTNVVDELNFDPNAGYLDYLKSDIEGGGDLSRLSALADMQAQQEAEVLRIEAELQKAKEKLTDLAERQIPELMDKVGMDEFKTKSGLVVKIDEKIRASIPKLKKPYAFAWLREHGNDSIIKRSLSVAFGRGEDDLANELCSRLSQEGFSIKDDESVHASTLTSFVKEKLQAGEDIPIDLFGVYRQRVSKIKT